MIRSRAGKDPVFTTIDRLSAGTVSVSSHALLPLRLLQHPVRHLRGIARLARRRHTFALALLAGTASVAGAITASAHLWNIPATPLAKPRPVASANETASVLKSQPRPKHHLIADALHSHPLRGLASWYGSVWEGRKTASGEVFSGVELTAAHRTLPFGTRVRVTDLRSLRSVIVRINDRGTLAPGRVIDLSAAAANKLGITDSGLARVKLEILS